MPPPLVRRASYASRARDGAAACRCHERHAGPRAAGCGSIRRTATVRAPRRPTIMATPFDPEYEYIVVGSGAGGGTLAARLAEAGRRVLLLEAGGDPRALTGDAAAPTHLPDHYDVPAFHSLASENEALAWNFFVQHHEDPARDRRDPKFRRHRGRPRRAGLPVPAGGGARRLHGPQRHDLGVSAQRRLGRAGGRRRVMRAGRRRRCGATSNASRTAGTGRSIAGWPGSA
jgi:hypothetical protein